MSALLHTLATRYAAAAAGRRGAVRDFLIDYEELLGLAGARDGDARELATGELARVAAESGGLLAIERHPRSGIAERVRLSRDGGEAWLFALAGLTAPGDERQQLAACFREARQLAVPTRFADGWREWLEHLAAAALAGESVEPFKRGDLAGTRELLETTAAVLSWRGESLLPYASAVICGDSKRLKALEARLLKTLSAVAGAPVSLDCFGILEKPRAVWFHGPLVVEAADGAVGDFSGMPGATGLSETTLDAAAAVRAMTEVCLTVENEAVFLELVKHNPGVLLVLTSFPGSAVLKLLGKLPPAMRCLHFGDTDPAGFDILRDLRERSGRAFAPLRMVPDATPGTVEFDGRERRTLERLLVSPVMADLRAMLERYLGGGVKGRFEQELVAVEEVAADLARLLPAR